MCMLYGPRLVKVRGLTAQEPSEQMNGNAGGLGDDCGIGWETGGCEEAAGEKGAWSEENSGD